MSINHSNAFDKNIDSSNFHSSKLLYFVFHTVYDRMEVKLPAWNSFYVNTLRKSRYGTVILVFDRLPEYMELFTWCDRLHVQWGQDGFGDFRKQEFKKMTVYMGMDELMDKMTEE